MSKPQPSLHQSKIPIPLWRLLIALLVPQLAFGLSYTWIDLAPHISEQNHWSPLLINTMYAVAPLSAALTLLASRWFTLLSNASTLCQMGVGLFVLGVSVALIWPSPLTFLVFFSILALGIGFGVNLTGALALITQIFPKHMGTISGLLTASYALAAVIEVPLVNSLIIGHRWYPALSMVSIGVMLLAMGAVFLLPRRLPIMGKKGTESTSSMTFRRTSLLLPAFLVTILVAPLGTYATSQIGVYARDVGLNASITTVAVIFTALGNTLGRFLGGLLSDHVGAYRILFLTVAIDAAAGIGLWRATESLSLVLFSMVIGITCGGLIGSIPRLAQEAIAPQTDIHGAIGILFAGISFGGFLGTLIGSWLEGSIVAWLIFGILAIWGLIVIGVHALLNRKPSER